jgi:hypothetical protein
MVSESVLLTAVAFIYQITKLLNYEFRSMSFVFNYFISMRYHLLGYLRHGLCLAYKIASQDQSQLVLLGISQGARTER